MTQPTNGELAVMLTTLIEQNEKDHGELKEYHKVQNGNIERNTTHRIKQQTHNRWMYVIALSIIVPLGFLLIKIKL